MAAAYVGQHAGLIQQQASHAGRQNAYLSAPDRGLLDLSKGRYVTDYPPYFGQALAWRGN